MIDCAVCLAGPDSQVSIHCGRVVVPGWIWLLPSSDVVFCGNDCVCRLHGDDVDFISCTSSMCTFDSQTLLMAQSFAFTVSQVYKEHMSLPLKAE